VKKEERAWRNFLNQCLRGQKQEEKQEEEQKEKQEEEQKVKQKVKAALPD